MERQNGMQFFGEWSFAEECVLINEPLERESCLLAINPLIFTLNALLKKFQRIHFFVGL